MCARLCECASWCMRALYTVGDIRNERGRLLRCPCADPLPNPLCPLCLWALLARACLSIFVTGSKFDVSYFQLTASEPCMNELVIYTKCLIKSAAAPGINIVGRLGMFTARGWGFAQRCVCGSHILPDSHLVCSVVLCDCGASCRTQYLFFVLINAHFDCWISTIWLRIKFGNQYDFIFVYHFLTHLKKISKSHTLWKEY